MSATGDGASTYLDTAATITALTTAYSYSFWYKATHVPASGGGVSAILSLKAGGGSTYDLDFIWDHSSGVFYRSAVHLNNGGGQSVVQFPSAPASGVWIHIGVVWDGVLFNLYYNGNLVAAAAGGVNPPNVDPKITLLASEGPTFFMDGELSQVTFWNIALTAAQMFSLGTGTLSTTIANASIVFYSTLNTGDPGAIGPALTNHGTTINTTSFFSSDGGESLGGTGTVSAANYGFIPSGGIALGGSATISGAIYHFTSSGGISLGGDQTVSAASYGITSDGGIAIGGNGMGIKTQYLVVATGGIAMISDSPYILATSNGSVTIASGRSSAYTTK